MKFLFFQFTVNQKKKKKMYILYTIIQIALERQNRVLIT